MTDATTLLQHLGFGEYEARAYVALLQRNPLNGYELAKHSGIPRANIYGVLQRLEERGAVVRLDQPSGPRFTALPPTDLIQRLGNRVQQTLQAAQEALSDLASPADVAYIWNVRGYELLLEHARSLIGATRDRLLIAIWPDEAKALAPALVEAEARGVAITTLCLPACPSECGGCRGQIFRYRTAAQPQARWMVLVPDGQEVLAGEITSAEDALAVRTQQRPLVELAVWYIRHSIALAAVLNDLGERLPQLLAQETRAILASLGPERAEAGWLEYMGRLLGLRVHE